MRLACLSALLLVLETTAHWGRSSKNRYAEWLPNWMQDLTEEFTDASGMYSWPKWQRKICKAELQRNLQTERENSKRLDRELQKERALKQQNEIQLEKDRRQQASDAKLLTKVEKQLHNERRRANKADELLQSKQASGAKVLAQLELQVENQRQQANKAKEELRRTQDQLLNTEERIMKLETLVGVEKRRADNATAELKSVHNKLLLLRQSQECQLCPEPLLQTASDRTSQSDQDEEAAKAMGTTLRGCPSQNDDSVSTLSGVSVALIAGLCAAAWLVQSLKGKLNLALAELSAKSSRLSIAEAEISCELGGMMKLNQSSSNLGTDFTYHIFDEMKDQEKMRFIKIQCSGVYHRNVAVEIIFNGCVVNISRQPSEGVGGTEWSQRFQFRPSEGLFEFKEDQAALEAGYLTLVFRATDYQRRIFRFPKHFDMSAADTDGAYEFPEESTGGNGTEASMRGGTAPGRLELTAAAAEFGLQAVAAPEAETSGSPVDTEDYEATVKAIALAATVQGSASCGVDANTGTALLTSPSKGEKMVPPTSLGASVADHTAEEVDTRIEQESEGTADNDGKENPPSHAQAPFQNSECASSQVNSEDFEKVQDIEDVGF